MKKYTKANAIVFDDHSLFADALALVLTRLDYFSDVVVVKNEQELRAQLIRWNKVPVYLYLDYYMPGCNVTHLIADIKRLFHNTYIIIISSFTNPTVIKGVYMQKPAAIIGKTAQVSEIISCLNTIEQNEIYLSEFIADILKSQQFDTIEILFTPKEMEILAHINSGKNIQQTAELLNISRHTVVTHRRNMMAKTNCHSVTELISYCRQIGLGPVDH